MLKRFLLVSFVSFSTLVHAQKSDTLVFATYRYAENNRIKNIQPFADYFGKITGMPVKVKSYNSVHELISGMKAGETDVVFINTFGYLMLREQSQDYSIVAALSIPDATRSTYQTAIVSGSHSGLHSFEDLVNQPGKFSMLFVNPGSTSGNLIPRLKFSEVGISEPEKFFTSVGYTKNHALTLKEIAEGKADIGAFGSEEYHRALALDSTTQTKVHLLWESSPIPLGPVLIRNSSAKSLILKLHQSLLTLHEKNLAALNAIKSGWTEAIPADKFQVVDERYYDALLKGNHENGMKIIRQFAQ